MSKAIYPGTFDPPTNGHLDIIVRAANIFDELIVCVGSNSEKRCLFSDNERVALLRAITQSIDNVEVAVYSGLTALFAAECKAATIVRGIRSSADYELEITMALANRRLAPGIDVIFLPSADRNMFISSSLVKEIARYGGDVSDYISPYVNEKLKDKLSAK